VRIARTLSTSAALAGAALLACLASGPISAKADDASAGASKTREAPPWAAASDSARTRVNPYAGHADAVRAGRKLFTRHCAECHGRDGAGGRNAPPLDTDVVRDATAGELFWTLTNGHLKGGMPSWSNLPEARRWQIVSYLKTLEMPRGGGAASPR